MRGSLWSWLGIRLVSNRRVCDPCKLHRNHLLLLFLSLTNYFVSFLVGKRYNREPLYICMAGMRNISTLQIQRGNSFFDDLNIDISPPYDPLFSISLNQVLAYPPDCCAVQSKNTIDRQFGFASWWNKSLVSNGPI